MLFQTAKNVVIDLTICFCSSTHHSSVCQCNSKPLIWKRLEKDLLLGTSKQTAWLFFALKELKEVDTDEVVITDIKICEDSPSNTTNETWVRRPGGIWLLRAKFTGDEQQYVTEIDILFGSDAVDPRPRWTIIQSPLRLNTKLEGLVAKLTIRRNGPAPAQPCLPLRANEDDKFKIVQFSDTHVVTGVGLCKDASDANGQPLPESEADPFTARLMSEILDVEKPDLVLLTGDQLHHDIADSQSAMFKVFAPMIERQIPYAAVFGNHDDEGTNALSRMAQMALLQKLPFSLAQPGPHEVDGAGNYYLVIYDHTTSSIPVSTLYFLDSHGQIPSNIKDPDYEAIKPTQIEWFTKTSQSLRKKREEQDSHNSPAYHLSLAFWHIPLPEYTDPNLSIIGGQRHEPTEGPSVNSHFYDALVKEGVVAVGCGHDHVNDFCGLLPAKGTTTTGPWLCHSGTCGFGGYCSYGTERYHRRARVWEIDTTTGSLKSWKRVEYVGGRVDEIVLVEKGVVVPPHQ
ncbi:Metallo-dependent phosphatase [Microthyrium microscopicum]|uniref:Metallo-dependent phosphatase n=1 Tax=Microthyrium microscopicum TaxID=703497 RepID=A0A6A6U6X8_9PEZI|nr:Metallo-dependent phosphatase [Microthyrium microscopicum]